MLGFEARKRLTQPAEFSTVKKSGRRFSDVLFVISAMHNQRAHARLGLAIATRVFGTAVARNRVKRLIRESFRQHQHALPAVDITVAARDAARTASAAQLRASLETSWKNIAERL
ncbi:MAG: ribonuclease P protein component [Proteobacteria bacterium]|nr:ribonuclease P protein component [Pseudomonadota bacterium]